TGMIPSGFSKTNPGIIDPEIKARQKQTPNAVSSTQDSGFLNRIGQTAKQVASRVQSNVDPDTDPAVIAHQSGMPIVNRALSLIPKETWAHMAANPQHPFWQRLGAAIVEEGRRVGSSIFNQASVFGDVARGKANINDPKTQQRIMGAALTFGLAGDAANVGAITGRKAVQDAVKAKDANPAKASEMRLSENPSVIKPHIKPKVKTPGKEEIAPAGGSEQPASVPLVKPHIKPKIIDLNKPISVGAQSTPAHEILVQNIKERELAEAKTHPELKQHLRAAANVLKAIAHPQGLRSPLTGRAYGHEAATTIRKFAGRAAAASNQSKAMLGAQMQVYKTMNNLSPQEGLQVLKWLQKPSTREVGLYHPTQGIKEFMDTFKEVMDNIATRLASLPKTSEMEFKKDFVSQIWREPVKVLGYLQSLAPKQGSGYFTKGSVFDDYEEGIRAGFIPLSTNPLEIGLRYVENANKFMHMNEILDEGTAQGNIVWRTNI
ncbi:MAG: hypothetical protein KGI08_10355, partial [Thaumarchaeota archaeon]|nr:hypothetical protein [Nitrososphaerota archaeon]